MHTRSRNAILGMLFVLVLAGCGRPSVEVSGKVTCKGKAVKGSILVSPLGDGPENTGPGVPATLAEDGSYQLTLGTTGKHRFVVNPSDVKYPAPPGESYPCDLKPVEHNLAAGKNEIIIEMKHRGR